MEVGKVNCGVKLWCKGEGKRKEKGVRRGENGKRW